MNDKDKPVTKIDYFKMDKISRCQFFFENGQIPNSYQENTLKEELILEHVLQYKKEFALTYDTKRELLLFPKNECDKLKFICTTIRPTKVPYPELYDYKKCAKFISEFLQYEELKPPYQFPKCIPSPDNVFKWQVGDCFDFAIVLCSLLIGAGFNAYVVYGKAPRFITSKDESRMEPPDLTDDIRIIEPNLDEKEDDSQPTIPDKPVIISQYDVNEEQEKDHAQKEEERKRTVIDDDQPELDRHDPFMHRRLHAWVLLRKNSRIDTSTFVEPTTGRVYDLKASPPYESIEAIFNNHNFYINLKPELKVMEIDWNLKNPNNWEYVMLNQADNNEPDQEEILEDNAEQFNEVVGYRGSYSSTHAINIGSSLVQPLASPQHQTQEKPSEVLDMPPPWSNKIMIPLSAYNNRTATATQAYYYEKTKVEKYAPYTQPDGMSMKIFYYKDFARFLLDRVEYRFRNRGDKLYKRIKYPYEHKTVEYYLPGQPWHWKTVEEVEASYRKTIFYPTNFDHCIIYREEIYGSKIIHRYANRDDKVYERKVLLNKESEGNPTSYQFFIDSPLYDNKLLITKFSQKSHHNPLLQRETQIEKLWYKFDKGTHIQVKNHYGKGRILSKPEYFFFPDENSASSEDKEDSAKKLDDDKEIWKRQMNILKSTLIDDFKKIEDFYNFKYLDNLTYNKTIEENRYFIAETNKALYEKGVGSIAVLEKNIFDLDQSGNENDKDKNKTDFTGEDQKYNRIQFFINLQNEQLQKNEEDKEKIKNNIIQIFKDEKTEVTILLQQLLQEQVNALRIEMDNFKGKETFQKEEIDKHNEVVNDIQRKINIIYQRSHKHITKIMEELNILLQELDKNANK